MRTEQFEEVINNRKKRVKAFYAVKQKNTQPMIDYIISKWQRIAEMHSG